MARSYEDEFTEETVKEAWRRAEGRCELCNKQLVYKNRDKDFEDTAWNAHHKITVADGGSASLSNCQILCLDCHKEVHSSK